MEDQGEVGKAFLQWEGEVGPFVDREVFSQWRRGDLRTPVEG